jgi:hypothetical protein
MIARTRFAVLVLAVLGAVGCASSDEPAGEPLPLVVESRAHCLGLWEATRVGGKSLGTIRVGHAPGGDDLTAEVFLSSDPMALPIQVVLRPEGQWVWAGSRLKPKALIRIGPWLKGEDGAVPATLALGSMSASVNLRRISAACPVCAGEVEVAAAYCSRCGRDLTLEARQDIHLTWRQGSEPLFSAVDLERVLDPALQRPHRIEVSDCSVQITDKRQDAVGVTSWIFLGVFAGFMDWSYVLTGSLVVDGGPAQALRATFELDFFERNEGGSEVFLALVSFAYPAPLVAQDPIVVGRVAAGELAKLCVAATEGRAP